MSHSWPVVCFLVMHTTWPIATLLASVSMM